MRVQFLAFVAAALASASLFGAGAFDAADASTRGVDVTIAGDAAAYLAVAANGASPHDCFISDTADGLAITFGATDATCGANGGGSGLNTGSASDATRTVRYAFHDILLVTNKGTKSILAWTNATTTSGSGSLVEVAAKTASGAMGTADYGASAATGTAIAPGASIYLGVQATVGQLTSAQSVTGTLRIETRLT